MNLKSFIILFIFVDLSCPGGDIVANFPLFLGKRWASPLGRARGSQKMTNTFHPQFQISEGGHFPVAGPRFASLGSSAGFGKVIKHIQHHVGGFKSGSHLGCHLNIIITFVFLIMEYF